MDERGEFKELRSQGIWGKGKSSFLIGILGWPVDPVVSYQGQFIGMNANYPNLVRVKEDGEWEPSVREET